MCIRDSSEGDWEVARIEHPDHGHCLDKKQLYKRYTEFVRDCNGIPLSNVSFWKQWLKVFPHARGGMAEWPRSRPGSGFGRLVVIQSRQEMCADYRKFYGMASDEVLNATNDWEPPNDGM